LVALLPDEQPNIAIMDQELGICWDKDLIISFEGHTVGITDVQDDFHWFEELSMEPLFLIIKNISTYKKMK
jgi:hypothetical protein